MQNEMCTFFTRLYFKKLKKIIEYFTVIALNYFHSACVNCKTVGNYKI